MFQSFHLIPTMTALENVAVPLELAGAADAFERAAQELASVGLRDASNHYPAELSGGEQQRVALARALAPHPAILVADEPTGNLDEATGREIIELLFAGHEKRGTTLVLVTHDAALAQRCDRVVRLRSGRIEDAGDGRMSAHAAAAALTLRFALREMRGGLRGFAVFIACIALGVAAIAGVGSFARSLADGLAREGRVILGGDVSFSLMAARGERGRARLPRRTTAASRSPPPCGRWRAPPTAETALVEIKAVDGAYPLFGAVALGADGRSCRTRWRSATALSAPPSIPALLARLDLERGARITVGGGHASSCARCCKSEPDKLAGGIGFGPRLLISEAALRATGLMQPGSLVRWHYRLRMPGADAERSRRERRGRRRPRRNCPTPAGKCARAPTPRPRSAATSSASRNTSRWSA